MSEALDLRQVCPLKTSELIEFIIEIGEAIANRKLYSYQKVLVIAIVRACLIKAKGRKHSEPTALFPRQSGKSEALSLACIACTTVLPWLAKMYPGDARVNSYDKGFWVTCYAPKQDKADIIYKRVREFAISMGDPKHKVVVEKIYRDLGIRVTKSKADMSAWDNGSWVQAVSASEVVDNEGATNHMVVIDEAQKMSTYKINKELRPTLASTNGPMVSIGTANASKGYFFRKIERNLEEGKILGKKFHFQYDYKVVLRERRKRYNEELTRYEAFQKADDSEKLRMLSDDPEASEPPNEGHLFYEDFVQSQLEEVRGNIEDETFKMNFRLLWLDNRYNAISVHLFNILRLPTMEMNQVSVMNPVGAGLDIAKGAGGRSDQTVLTLGAIDIQGRTLDRLVRKQSEPSYHYQKVIINLTTAQGSFEEYQYDKILNTLLRYPTCTCIYIDATGMGDPVCERLTKILHWIKVIPYSYNASSKSYMFKRYLAELKSHRIRYAAGPQTVKTLQYEEFVEQHVDLQKFVVQDKYETCAAEEGKHDDYPNSAALMNLACEAIVSDPTLVKKMLNRAEQVHRLTGNLDPYKRGRDHYREARF